MIECAFHLLARLMHKIKLRDFFTLILLYWRSKDPSVKFSLIYFILSLALVIFVVGVNVFFNQLSGQFMNAIQDYNLPAILHIVLISVIIFVVFSVFSAYQDYFYNLMQIRWRNWLTSHFISKWLHAHAYYAIETFERPIDNVDQRISDDINQMISIFSNLTLGVFNAVLSMGSFAVILWTLSTPLEIPLPYHHHFILHGDMVWFSLIYSIINTYFTFKIGRPLIQLSFQQQRFEAFFRYHLMRIRENSEQIALYKAESFEQKSLHQQFGNIVANFILIIRRQRLLALFTNLVSISANFVPTLLALPGYFAHRYKMGGITQITQAFSVVNNSLTFFISNYMQIAVIAATAGRLQQLSDESLRAETPQALPYPPLQVRYHQQNTLVLEAIPLFKPDQHLLLPPLNLEFKAGEHTLLMGPSGIGKSTLLRTIAGIWPYASGQIIKPNGSFWFVPQKPYLPEGSLRDIMIFPDPSIYDEAHIIEALRAVGLQNFIPELGVSANYAQKLSLGEQQRLAFARLLIHQPQWILLDEASSSLDKNSEAQLYQLIQERLPQATLISIGHRSTLERFHPRKLILANAPL